MEDATVYYTESWTNDEGATETREVTDANGNG